MSRNIPSESLKIRALIAAWAFVSLVGCKTPTSGVNNVESPPERLGQNSTDPISEIERGSSYEEWFNFNSRHDSRRDPVAVVANPAGNSVLRAVDCERLNKVMQALATMNKTSSGLATVRVQKTIDNLWCEAIIDPLLTETQRRVMWRAGGDTTDTNCWGAALNFSGVLDEWTYTENLSWRYFLNSPQCRYLPPNESARPGDLVDVRSKDALGAWSEIHGAIYINDDLWLTKNGGGPVFLTSPADVMATYGSNEPSRCFDNRSDRRGCSTALSYYRCSSTAVYLQAAETSPIAAAISQLRTDLEPILSDFERNILEGISHDDYDLSNSYASNERFAWGRVWADSFTPEEKTQVDGFFNLGLTGPDGRTNFIETSPTNYTIPPYSNGFRSYVAQQVPGGACNSLQDSLLFYSCIYRGDNEGYFDARDAFIRERMDQVKQLTAELWTKHKAEPTNAEITKQLHLATGLIYRFFSLWRIHVIWTELEYDAFWAYYLPADYKPLESFIAAGNQPRLPESSATASIVASCKKCKLYLAGLTDTSRAAVKLTLDQVLAGAGIDAYVSGQGGSVSHNGGSHWTIKIRARNGSTLTSEALATALKSKNIRLKLLTSWD